MLLSILELIITLGCILEQDGLHVTAANIMLGKPLFTRHHIYTAHQLNPFWQGDLQGFYAVDNITITKFNDIHIRNAYIGVSSVDVDCPNDDVTWCGQWPADTSEGVLTFNCSHEQPVRFVRVWRNITGYLVLREVEVEGTPRRQTGKNAAKYDKSLNTKLTQTVTSVNAVSAIHCSTKCLANQPCLAFSYNPSVQLPCVFATSTATTAVTGWATYFPSTCFKATTWD